MKKFYYSKETSQDESPKAFSMERRDKIDINNEHGRGMSARAASVNSLDLMSEAPSIPRATTRDMTRSLSDATTRSQSQKQKLVTETELSSSWLYKTMQASINARFKSPRKSPSVHNSGDLEQSILQDPELKPIPIKSKATKTSSCICHFATMIAISLCTIGFLASIAAIIYMEIFVDRNITSLHTPEAQVVFSDVAIDSLETYNLTTHNVEGEGHILNEARTHRFDGDEEILNEAIKASSTNDIPSLSNANKSQGLFSDYVTDVDNPKVPELKPYIHDNNSNIKFQDGVTVIYEMKQASTKDVESDFSDSFRGRSFGFESEEDSKDSFGKSAENEENNLKQESDIYTEPNRTIENDSLFLDNAESINKSHDFTANKNSLNDLKETVSEDKLKLKGVPENIKVNKLVKNESFDKIFHDVSLPSEKLNSSEIFQSQNIEYEEGPYFNTTDILRDDARTDNTNKSDTNTITQLAKASDAILTNLSDFQFAQHEDVFRPTPEVNDSVADDHDVNTMLVTIDDTEVSTDSFISKRNGDINLFPVSSPVPSVEPIKQVNDNSPVSSKKPVDMKVSLADAMKHLQKLDVNNKLLTSRTKPKQKGSVQKPKRKTAFNNEEEKRRYLQRMRLMFFKHSQ